MENSILAELHDKSVRDLAWVIGSPGLLDPAFAEFQGRVVTDPFCADALQAAKGWLKELDRDPQSLHQYLQTHPVRRLGLYFELLTAFWLRHIPGLELEGMHFPVKRGKVTVGEFDFVFHYQEWGGRLHWEAAVKFYLKAKQGTHWEDYLGPNARDRLDLKVRRIFEHQLKLGEQPEGWVLLGLGSRPITPQTFFKGYLFYPADADGVTSVPQGLSSRHLRGWWFRHGEGMLKPQMGGTRWCVLERLSWLSPCRLQAGQDPVGMELDVIRKEIDRHFAHADRALLVAELSPNRYGGWDEVSRGFVVSRRWPDSPGDTG